MQVGERSKGKAKDILIRYYGGPKENRARSSSQEPKEGVITRGAKLRGLRKAGLLRPSVATKRRRQYKRWTADTGRRAGRWPSLSRMLVCGGMGVNVWMRSSSKLHNTVSVGMFM